MPRLVDHDQPGSSKSTLSGWPRGPARRPGAAGSPGGSRSGLGRGVGHRRAVQAHPALGDQRPDPGPRHFRQQVGQHLVDVAGGLLRRHRDDEDAKRVLFSRVVERQAPFVPVAASWRASARRRRPPPTASNAVMRDGIAQVRLRVLPCSLARGTWRPWLGTGVVLLCCRRHPIRGREINREARGRGMQMDRRRALVLHGDWEATAPASEVRARGAPAFLHGVASGDPLQDRVILWTRITARGSDEIAYSWMLDPVDRKGGGKRGSGVTGPDRDFTVKVDAVNFDPGRTYNFQFEAGGVKSPVGRTRTLPDGPTKEAVLAVCTCALYPNGYFNAYGAIAKLARVDAVVHLGDYIYEYGGPGSYGMDSAVAGERAHDPGRECGQPLRLPSPPRPVQDSTRSCKPLHARAPVDRRLGRLRDRQRQLDRRGGEPSARLHRGRPGTSARLRRSRPITSGCRSASRRGRRLLRSTAASTSGDVASLFMRWRPG